MKSILLSTAVLLAVGELRQLQPTGFSIHDVTKRLREQVANGDVEFSDRHLEMINGQMTFRVDHESVKTIFTEYLDQGILTGLDKDYSPAGFRIFVNRPAVVVQNSTPTIPVQTGSPITQSPQAVKVTNSPATPQKAGKVFPTIHNQLTQDAIRNYLTNTPRGQVRTMKEIQSRLKGFSVTCQEIYDFLTNDGYLTRNDSAPYSQRTVPM
jgi:hypothetical protein